MTIPAIISRHPTYDINSYSQVLYAINFIYARLLFVVPESTLLKTLNFYHTNKSQ
jgi:hypothetical protein